MNRLVLVAALLVARGAYAFTPGGGSPLTDCLAEFGGTPANHPPTKPKEIRCVDNDVTCDDDPAHGVCGFRIGVCTNVTDPNLPGCVPADLDEYAVENPQPDTNPLHDFDFQALEDEMTFLFLPVTAGQTDLCSGEVPVSVYLPITLGQGTARYRKGKKKLETTITGPAAEDVDTMKLTCVPNETEDPCDGVVSTLDQIEKHVFTPTTCTRSTCHNVSQPPHDLVLEPGQSHANLVGIAPSNPVAALAGKARVDPGNPANSFLVDKLRGVLLPGEGERMPLGLKKAAERQIRLVEEWIAAGAPAVGKVAASGCP